MSYSHRDPSLGGSSQYSTGFSEAPSTSTAYTMTTQYSQYTAYNMQPNGAPVATNVLPCEFVGIGSCDVTFRLDDTEAWIEHIVVDHLNDKLPSKAICWFCDDIEFDSKKRNFQGDRHFSFHCRMEHIREHVMEGKTVDDMRADRLL